MKNVLLIVSSLYRKSRGLLSSPRSRRMDKGWLVVLCVFDQSQEEQSVRRPCGPAR